MERVFLFSSGELKRHSNTLLLEKSDGDKVFIPVEGLHEVYVFGSVKMNTELLNFLSQKGVILHVFNYYGFYSGSYVPRRTQVSGYLLTKQVEHYLSKEKRLYLAKSFVYSAIHHIRRNLRKRKFFISEIDELQTSVYTVSEIPELMQLEGKARMVYYQQFSTILKDEDFHFVKRTKRPPVDPINALISYGNSVLYSVVLSEIYKTQLDPTISYLHEPSTSRYSLALDISEIFKPLVVDSVIFSLINKRVLSKSDFEKDFNYTILSTSGRRKFVDHFEKKLSSTVHHRSLKRKVSYRYMMRLECYKLIKHLIGDEIYQPLKAWW